MSKSFLLLVAGILIAGCAKKELSSASMAGSEKPGAPPDRLGSSSVPPSITKKETKPPESPTSPPAALQHDAYHYYGLANTSPFKLKFSLAGSDEIRGEQTAKVKEMKKDRWVYAVTRTEGLAQLGNDEVALQSDGIYTVSTTLGKLDQKELELPASLPTGKSWWRTEKLTETTGQVVQTRAVYKVVGVQKIETSAGPFEALLITADGTAKFDDKPGSMNSKFWFARDIGMVKMESKVKLKGGKEVHYSIEATK